MGASWCPHCVNLTKQIHEDETASKAVQDGKFVVCYMDQAKTVKVNDREWEVPKCDSKHEETLKSLGLTGGFESLEAFPTLVVNGKVSLGAPSNGVQGLYIN